MKPNINDRSCSARVLQTLAFAAAGLFLAAGCSPSQAEESAAESVQQAATTATPATLCPSACNDGNPCTTDTCTSTGCKHVAVADNTACSDGNACTTGDFCKAGKCQPGPTPTKCDDNNPCTADSCDVTAGCKHVAVANGTSCSDGNACNGREVCSSGVCKAGTPVNCNDNNACTTDTCNTSTGACSHASAPNGSSCSDGNVCNGAETCSSGVCKPGTALNCNDSNPCTDDSCDPVKGCGHNSQNQEGNSCSDGNVCNGKEVCYKGICQPGTALNCDDGNPCTADSCDKQLGCKHVAVANGASCSDGNVCNGTEICRNGLCGGSTNPPNCDDGNPCTADSCDKVAGCKHAPVANGASCADANVCNGKEICQMGVCKPGTALNCDDSNPCTADSCDKLAGCKHVAVANGASCSDGNVCNGTEICRNGSCAGSVNPLNCDDNNPCTADSCDKVAGCKHAPVANGTSCSDGNACNGKETCQTGVCKPGTPINCDDGKKCTTDTCIPSTGACAHATAPNGTSCSDGNKCNGEETCQSGNCAAGTALNCDDHNACTADSCDATVGCKHTPVSNGTSCADANKCNGTESCQNGACAGGTPLSCDDQNPCTADSCDPAVGCKHTAVADGTTCPQGVCKAGTCTPNNTCVPADCNDNNPCTTDVCSATAGCVHTPVANGRTCADNKRCNGDEACQNGSCAAGTPLDCDDQNPCTADVCDETAGCKHTAVADGIACGDSNKCNGDEVCSAGVCKTSAPLNCDDGNPCTADSCDATTGCKHTNAADGSSCSDGNACNGNDVCESGACVGSNAQLWGKGFDFPLAGALAVDGSGSEYIAGSYNHPVDLGGGPLTADPFMSFDALVAKFDKNGNHLWSRGFSSALDQTASLIAADGAGHVIAGGFFQGALDLDVAQFDTGGAASVHWWLAEFDASTGATIWAKDIDLGDGQLTGLKIDKNDNSIVIAGSSSKNVNLGGGLLSGTTLDVIVARFKADGTHMASKRFGGAGSQEARTVAVAADSSVGVAGMYDGTLDFGGGALAAPAGSAQNHFVAELTSTLTFKWSKAGATVPTDAPGKPTGASFNGAGDLFVGGEYSGTLNYGLGALTSTGRLDGFAARFSGATGTAVWSKSFGSSDSSTDQVVNDVSVDGSGDLVLGGFFAGSINLGGGVLPSAGSFDAFAAKLHGVDGSQSWAKRAGNDNQQAVQKVAVGIGSDGAVSLYGIFIGSVNWGTTSATDITEPTNLDFHAFLAKIAPGENVPVCDDGNPCTADSCDQTLGCVHTVAAEGSSCSDGTVCNGAEICHAGVCAPGTVLNCNDNNPCTGDFCDPTSGCAHANVANGVSCDDGNACNGTETCQSGQCTPGTGPACDDNNPCTTDSCDAVAGCKHTPVADSTSCADANVCNGAESCVAGVCKAGTPLSTDDGNPCTADACDPVTGVSHTPAANGTSCSDGNACNGPETCSNGSCVEGEAPSCDDGNPCTADSCDAATGCKHVAAANGTSCSDGNVCNGDETCQSGACVTTPGTGTCNDNNPCTVDSCDAAGGCRFIPVADGTACPANGCGTAACTAGTCVQTGTTNCDDNNPCTADGCDTSGNCTHTPVANGTACGDSNKCNGDDSCQNGTCTTGAAPNCDDSNPCTADSCDAATGCKHVASADGTSCSDGNPCNGEETCSAGTCHAGTTLSCDDSNPCTADSCDAASGCKHVAAADGTACPITGCATSASCTAGACVQGPGKSCEDNNPCTADSCDQATGNCIHTPVGNGTACSDGNACNGEEACQTGVCTSGTALNCDDHNPCTADSCDAAMGCKHVNTTNGSSCGDGNKCNGDETCQNGTCAAGTTLGCDDNNPCTADSCDAVQGCLHTSSPDNTSCSDGNTCNGAETCQSGQCRPGTTLSCDDHNPCTTDSCDAVNGCVHAAVADGTTCPNTGCNTGSACLGGACVQGPGKSCEDNNPCTADSCDQVTGDCIHSPVANGTTCSDGNACNGAESCQSGICAPGTPLGCDDGNPCTADACDAATGCTHAPLSGASCSDGNACNGVESCSSGVCLPGTALSCDDHNPCTADACDAASGCTHAPLSGTSCSDGNACNGAETCQGGTCTAGTAPSCDDSNPCTADACDAASGCTHAPLSGTSCSDGNACNGAETCQSGTCAPGTSLSCEDNNPCTADACDPASGCTHVAVAAGTSCSNGNACDGAETCQGTVCTTGPALDCEDHNPCTADSCSAASGCVHTPIDGASCADTNTCNGTEVCMGGTCQSGTPLSCDDNVACTADSCDAVNGCQHTPSNAACDDSDPCTADACSATGGCSHTPIPPGTGTCPAPSSCFTAGPGRVDQAPIANGLALDAAGNQYVVGAFTGSFDTGAGPNGCGTLTSAGRFDIFIVSYDAANNCRFAKSYGDPTENQLATAVTLDTAGELIVSGTFKSDLDFGITVDVDVDGSGPTPQPVTGLSAGAEQAWVAMFDVTTTPGDARPIWAKAYQLGAGGNLPAMAADPVGTKDFVVVGTHGGQVTATNPPTNIFGCGALVGNSTAPNTDVVVAHLATDGTAVDPNLVDVNGDPVSVPAPRCVWAKRFGGGVGVAGDQVGRGVAVDATGNVTFVGTYAGAAFTVTGTPAMPAPFSTVTSGNLFAAKLNSAGTAVWAKGFGDATQGATNQVATSVALDAAGNPVFVGSMQGVVNFGGPSLSSTAGSSDVLAVALNGTTGATLWAQRWGDGTNAQTANTVLIDGAKVIVGGEFQGSVNFGAAGNLASAGNFDAFLANLKLSDGTATCAQNAGDNHDQSITQVVSGAPGTLRALGKLVGSINFGSTPATALSEPSGVDFAFFLEGLTY